MSKNARLSMLEKVQKLTTDPYPNTQQSQI